MAAASSHAMLLAVYVWGTKRSGKSSACIGTSASSTLSMLAVFSLVSSLGAAASAIRHSEPDKSFSHTGAASTQRMVAAADHAILLAAHLLATRASQERATASNT
eukprot:gnl/MRDRNA2_/MRDRNA2_50267_c0_seq1.p2 gnl/MRDRNA2_/MRDRNA2_50267_c0~~gnl/MRDRNA2_/MRDRNA2_50267_c0_seq1.p2  ORF type:complete len:105 (+),score=10.17 gnl/MRDRNA2_/MRDRNA2_50267_c0_seq1:256-570(+)